MSIFRPDAFGTTPIEWKTLKWPAQSAPSVTTATGTRSSAALCGAANKKGDTVKNMGRMLLAKDQVTHEEGGTCFICGLTATKVVKGKHLIGEKRKVVRLCTAHFAQLFRLPPTRHPKQKRTHTVQTYREGDVRRFELRQFLKAPLVFTGERTASHMATLGRSQWYFALYANHDASNQVLSVTRIVREKRPKPIKKKPIAIHFVRPNIRTEAGQRATLKAMIQKHDNAMRIPYLTRLQIEATKFIEMIQ